MSSEEISKIRSKYLCNPVLQSINVKDIDDDIDEDILTTVTNTKKRYSICQENVESSIKVIQAQHDVYISLKNEKKSIYPSEQINSFGWKDKEQEIQYDIFMIYRELFKSILLGLQQEGKLLQIKQQKYMFYIYTKNVILCNICNTTKIISRQRVSEQLLPQIDDSYTLEDYLQKYISWQRIYGEQYCTICKKQVKELDLAIEIERLPMILVIGQLRSRYDVKKNIRYKMFTCCNIPKTLNCNTLLVSNDKDKYTYDFIGCITHAGLQPYTGHYRAYCIDKKYLWCFNDDKVKQVNEQNLFDGTIFGKNECVYMIIYRRRYPL